MDAVKLPITCREHVDANDVVIGTEYSNGMTRRILPHNLLGQARDPDAYFGHLLDSLKPNSRDYLFADTDRLNLMTSTETTPISNFTAAPDQDIPGLDITHKQFQPVGQLNNGLWAYDRKTIKAELPNYKPPDDLLFTAQTSMYSRIVRQTEDLVMDALRVPAQHFAPKFSWDLDVQPYTRGFARTYMGDLVDGDPTQGQPVRMPASQYPPPRYWPLGVVDGPEEAARGLLMRMIGFTAFKGYVKRGFVSYRAKSGRVYQVFPGMHMTHVWQHGQPLEKLCLVFQSRDMPPTDWVIMRLLMLENDEQGFRQMANSFSFSPPRRISREDQTVPAGRIARLAAERQALVRSA